MRQIVSIRLHEEIRSGKPLDCPQKLVVVIVRRWCNRIFHLRRRRSIELFFTRLRCTLLF